MIKPLTKLAPWRAAGRVTGKASGHPPAGSGRIPTAARTDFPITVPPQVAAAAAATAAAGLPPAIVPTLTQADVLSRRAHGFIRPSAPVELVNQPASRAR
jgi:hypothetical protein